MNLNVMVLIKKYLLTGSCLPKETHGMIKLQENLEIPNDVLTSLLKRTDFLRKK